MRGCANARVPDPTRPDPTKHTHTCRGRSVARVLCDLFHSRLVLVVVVVAVSLLVARHMGNCNCNLCHRDDDDDARPLVFLFYTPGWKHTKALRGDGGDGGDGDGDGDYDERAEDIRWLRRTCIESNVGAGDENKHHDDDDEGASRRQSRQQHRRQQQRHVARYLTRDALQPYLELLDAYDARRRARRRTDAPFAWTSVLCAPTQFSSYTEAAFELMNVLYLLALAAMRRAEASARSVRIGGERGDANADARAAYRAFVEAIGDLEAVRALRDARYAKAQRLRLPVDVSDAMLDALLHQCAAQAEEIAAVGALSQHTDAVDADSGGGPTTTAATTTRTATTPTSKTSLRAVAALAHSSARHYHAAKTSLSSAATAGDGPATDAHQVAVYTEYLQCKAEIATARARYAQALHLWTSQQQLQQQQRLSSDQDGSMSATALLRRGEAARAGALAAYHAALSAIGSARKQYAQTWCSRTPHRKRVQRALHALEAEIAARRDAADEENRRVHFGAFSDAGSAAAAPPPPPSLPEPSGTVAEVDAWQWRPH